MGATVNIWIPSVSSKGPGLSLLGTYLFIFPVNHGMREREAKKGEKNYFDMIKTSLCKNE